MVHAGYINNGHKQETHSLSGVPQGGVVSPILSNIYLHEFDTFMEGIKKEYTQEGVVSKARNEYSSIATEEIKARKVLKKILLENTVGKTDSEIDVRRKRARKAKAELKKYTALKRNTPSREKVLTRVYYVRYADD